MNPREIKLIHTCKLTYKVTVNHIFNWLPMFSTWFYFTLPYTVETELKPTLDNITHKPKLLEGLKYKLEDVQYTVRKTTNLKK